MITFGKEFGKIKSSNLFQVPIPPHLFEEGEVCNFMRLYKDFALGDKHMIPLALYRTETIIKEKKRAPKYTNNEKPEVDVGVEETQIHYVVTNPDPETPIKPSDLVFVLAHEDPEGETESNLPKTDKQIAPEPIASTSATKDRKIDENNMLFTKRAKAELQESYETLLSKIHRMMDDVVGIHEVLNKKSTYMIQQVINDVANIIEEVAREQKE